MFARKGLFSSIGRTTALATVAALALTAVEPSTAVAGPAKEKGLTAASAPVTPPISAPAAGIIAEEAGPLPRLRSLASSAPVSRSPRPKIAGTITMTTGRPIMAVAPSITAAPSLITALSLTTAGSLTTAADTITAAAVGGPTPADRTAAAAPSIP